jgi:hypothetical protein
MRVTFLMKMIYLLGCCDRPDDGGSIRIRIRIHIRRRENPESQCSFNA